MTSYLHLVMFLNASCVIVGLIPSRLIVVANELRTTWNDFPLDGWMDGFAFADKPLSFLLRLASRKQS